MFHRLALAALGLSLILSSTFTLRAEGDKPAEEPSEKEKQDAELKAKQEAQIKAKLEAEAKAKEDEAKAKAKEKAKQAADQRRQQAEKARKVQALDRQLREASAVEDWDTVLAVYDKIVAEVPEAKPNICVAKFGVLSMQKRDFPAAYKFARALLESDLKDDAQNLNAIAWFILDQEGLENRDFDVAMAIAKRAAEVSKFEDAPILDTLARAYYEKKDLDKAIEYQAKAVEKAKGRKDFDQIKAMLIRYQNAKVF
jgi:tetratricopeptide (TPR) repeat protein